MAKTPSKRPGRTIRSVKIALNVIELLQERDRIGVTDLANELGHSKSTVHSHLRTLEERKMIVRDGDGYRLSLRILDMAENVRNQIGNYDVIESEVDKLAEETGEIAQFALEEHGEVTYLYKATGEKAVETASRVGMQQPMYSTSLGKAILANSPSEQTKEIVQATEFAPKTPKTIANADDLYEQLAEIAERGYAIDDEENIEGLRCVAAPVKNGETVLGAISITGPSSRFTNDRLHGKLADTVQRASNIIELNTKYA